MVTALQPEHARDQRTFVIGLGAYSLLSNPAHHTILIQYSQIADVPLSFRTAKELRGRAEMLPSGPEWKFKPIPTQVPTKTPVRLFLRDPIECIQSLYSNPLLKDEFDVEPFRIYKTAEKLVRVYTEWMSGDCAWQMQVTSSVLRVLVLPDLFIVGPPT